MLYILITTVSKLVDTDKCVMRDPQILKPTRGGKVRETVKDYKQRNALFIYKILQDY